MLEAAHTPALDAVSAQLAAHYDRAGKAKEARAFYQRAARAAQQIGSSGEAARLLSRALTLLAGLPETPERDEQELELRAAISLGRLWHRQGRGAEARRLLEKAFSPFAEGFNTPDLEEAHALLQAWARGGRECGRTGVWEGR